MIEADEKTIRQYLLGELDEAEMSRFEERLMTDDELFEMLQVVEDDLLDEAAAHELSADEQARFDQYFLVSPDRRARLKMSLGLHDYADRHKERFIAKIIRLLRRRTPGVYLSFATAAVILIAIGVWLFIISPPRPPDVSKGLQALNQAYTENPTEVRITGLNLPPASVTRGGQPGSFDYVARDRAAALIQVEAVDHPGAESYHNLGLLYLAKDEFDKAIDQFEKALKLDGNNAQLHSDYGAALLEKGKA